MALSLGAALVPAQLSAQGFVGTGTVTTGAATITNGFNQTNVTVNAPETIIDWTTTQAGPLTTFDFLPENGSANFLGGPNTPVYTVLNRINSNFGTPVIQLNGAISSAAGGSLPGGTVWFYAPGGIVTGANATFNVGSLLLTSNAIDTTGGLYGPKGEIRFRGPAGSTSAITISNGTSIQTSVSNSYVAIVAPRVVQGGNIFVDGSTALVGAEQADLTFNAGLFDVTVLVGTTDPNGIVHTGSTGGPAATSVNDAQRVVMVAVPKNNALTMLLSGSIGYQAASIADQDGSAVMLSAGYNVSGDFASTDGPASAAPAGIDIDRSTFLSQFVNSFASGPINIAPSGAGSIEFLRGVTLHSDVSISVVAETAERVLFDDYAYLSAQNGLAGGTITLLATGESDPDFGSGRIAASNYLQLDASGSAGDGADITGGTITITANQGTISAGYLEAQTTGYGGEGNPNGGKGTGGSISVSATAGGTLSMSNLYLAADGEGGSGDIEIGTGGVGQGGRISVSEQNGMLDLGYVQLNASGYGGGAAIGGDGLGGRTSIDITTNPQSWSGLSIYAGASGGYNYPGAGGSAIADPDAVRVAISGDRRAEHRRFRPARRRLRRRDDQPVRAGHGRRHHRHGR